MMEVEVEVWGLLREPMADQMEMEGSETLVLMVVELVQWVVLEGWH